MPKKRNPLHAIKDHAIKTTKDTLSSIQNLKKQKPPKNPALKDVKYHLLGTRKRASKACHEVA
ncbi:MAG: hypothetical protein ABIG84_04095 [archaeon]